MDKKVLTFAAWVPDMFCDFNSVKNHKIARQPLQLEKK